MAEEKVYEVISGGIRVVIDKPKGENGSKLEQLQAKLDYHNNKVQYYKSEIRKIKYSEESFIIH